MNISSWSPVINKPRRLLPAISVTTCETVARRRSIDNTWQAGAFLGSEDIRGNCPWKARASRRRGGGVRKGGIPSPVGEGSGEPP